jgi:hypothetical protein
MSAIYPQADARRATLRVALGVVLAAFGFANAAAPQVEQAALATVEADGALHVRARGKSLALVLQGLATELGLSINQSERIDRRDRVAVDPSGDMRTVLGRLLRNYNYILQYDENGTIKGLIVIGRKSDVDDTDYSNLPAEDASPEEGAPPPDDDAEEPQ